MALSQPRSWLRGAELELLDALVAVRGPAVRNGASAEERATARKLLKMAPNAETPAETRAAWWKLVEAITTPARPLRDYGRDERPLGCPNGHDPSELAWHPDSRPESKKGGNWYCRACRREERREKGWS